MTSDLDVGYVYAVAFSNGTVKVGKTINPASHAEAAGSFDITVTGWWLTPAHAGYHRTEDAAIAAAESLLCGRNSRSRREYFHGVDYAQLLVRLQALNLDTAALAPVSTPQTSPQVTAHPSANNRISDGIPEEQLASHVEVVFAAALPWLTVPFEVPVAQPDRSRAFGDLIAHGRRRMSLDQEGFALAAGMSRSTVSRIERGMTVRPGLERFRRAVYVADVHEATATVALGMSTLSRIIADPRRY